MNDSQIFPDKTLNNKAKISKYVFIVAVFIILVLISYLIIRKVIAPVVQPGTQAVHLESPHEQAVMKSLDALRNAKQPVSADRQASIKELSKIRSKVTEDQKLEAIKNLSAAARQVKN